MSIKLKGSTDGSVSLDAPADTSPTGTDVSLTLPTSAGSANQFIKNGSTAGELEHSSMVETSTGIGVGTSSPVSKVHVIDSLTGGQLLVASAESDSTVKYGSIATVHYTNSQEPIAGVAVGAGATANTIYIGGGLGEFNAATDIRFYTASNSTTTTGTERLVVRNDGHIRFNQDSTNTPGLGNTTIGLGIESLSSGAAAFISRSDGATLFLNRNSDGSVTEFSRSGNLKGTISINNTNTAYNTTGSDRRLKKNFEDWTDTVLPAFRNLNPQKFHFNTQEDSEDKVEGYIAQDLAEHFPDAYPLSEVNIDGEQVERYMFNPSGMVVYLMKALQEATLEIDTLKTKVAALEAAS